MNDQATSSQSSVDPQPRSGESSKPAASDASSSPDPYEQAFARFLAPDAPEGDKSEPASAASSASAASGNPDDAAEQSEGEQRQGDGLSEQQKQLLSRWHMSPEMVEGWSEQQKAEFFENASKRESDASQTFRNLKQRLDALESETDDGSEDAEQPSADSGKAEDGGSGQGERSQEGDESGSGGVADEARKIVDEAIEVYGEEIGPLGQTTVKLAEQLDKTVSRLDQADQAAAMKDQLIVEMTLDSGIRDLRSDFPALDSDESRQQLLDRFERDWKQEDSPHRTGKGPLLKRVKAALRDAADSEFETQSAAQAANQDKTRQRLQNQPTAGAGKGRKAGPRTVDDVYDQAFEQHLRPQLSR